MTDTVTVLSSWLRALPLDGSDNEASRQAQAEIDGHIAQLEQELRHLEREAGLTPASRAALGFVEIRAASKLDEMAAARGRRDAR
jgi:hypothetical protein